MNISLTPELEDLVTQKVASGMYHSASEVIREGLRLLKDQDALKEMRLSALRREIDEGEQQIENGRFLEYRSGTEAMDAVSRRVTARRSSINKGAVSGE